MEEKKGHNSNPVNNKLLLNNYCTSVYNSKFIVLKFFIKKYLSENLTYTEFTDGHLKFSNFQNIQTEFKSKIVCVRFPVQLGSFIDSCG